MRKKVAFLVWYPRHLYWNWRHLCSHISESGVDITVLTHRREIAEQAQAAGLKAEVIAPKLEAAWGRLGRLSYILCWIWSWLFIAPRFFRYDLIVAPYDYGPLNYIASRLRPFIISRFSLGMYEKLFIQNMLRTGDPAEAMPEIPNHKYHFLNLIMGFNYRQGSFIPRSHHFVTVMSEAHKAFFLECGYREEQLKVTGSSNYAVLGNLEENSSRVRDRYLRNLAQDTAVLSVFPSSIEIVESEIRFLRSVAESLLSKLGKLRLVLKLHPRFPEGKVEMLERELVPEGVEVTVIRDALDDNMNAALIQLSDGVVISGSNVGFIAALLKKPLYSYSLDGERDLFAAAGASSYLEKPSDICDQWAGNVREGQSDGIIAPAANPSAEIASLVKDLLEGRS